MTIHTPGNHILKLVGVTKRYGDVVAVDDFSLDVREGEFVTLLGPSGCGKTTLLRTIAGFVAPSSGGIEIDGRDMLDVPAHKRPVNMVFQRHALFPHLTVFENIAFGLAIRRVDASQIRERVMEILDLVRLPGYGDRKVGELSGGEAQRVSLARALILRPRVLLLDEPLSALDLRIRQQMEIELARIHNELGTTFLSVTHDQGEAMKLSDTVVVMNKGRIEQVGTPEEIYNQPGSLFCASFVGESNLLSGRVVQVLHDLATVDLGVAAIRGRYAKHIPRVGEDVSVLVRAEAIELAPASSGSARDNELTGRVVGVLYLGSSVSYLVNVALNKELVVHASVKNRTQRIAREDAVRASWSRDDTLVL